MNLTREEREIVAQFDERLRREVRRLALVSPRCRDLLRSFPTLLGELANDAHRPALRWEARLMVEEGERLRDIAAVLSVPMWLRRFSPSLATPGLKPLPDEPHFARSVTNRMPQDPDAQPQWIADASAAYVACDAPFARWVVDRDISLMAPVECDWAMSVPQPPLASDFGGALMPRVMALALLAWHSKHSGGRAAGLIRLPWTPRWSVRRSCEEARFWLLDCAIDRARLRRYGAWLVSPTQVGRYHIEPLLSHEALRREGVRMRNCVRAYVGRLASGHSLIYRVDGPNGQTATLEVCRDVNGRCAVRQLKAAGNENAAEELTIAVLSWVSELGAWPDRAFGTRFDAGLDHPVWGGFWQPYLNEVATRLAFPIEPRHITVRWLWSQIDQMVGPMRM